MTDLTDRQREILVYLVSFLRSFQRPPTLREIGQDMEIGSTNGVNDHLVALEKKGYIRREGYRARSIRILRDADGHPVDGARVVPDRSELAGRVYYPTPDLTGAGQEGTGADGLFLYVHTGADAEAFRLSVEGAEGYLPRNVGASPGWGLVLTVYPGRFPPP